MSKSLVDELLSEQGKSGVKPEDESKEMKKGPVDNDDEMLDEEVRFRALAKVFNSLEEEVLSEGLNVVKLNRQTKAANLASRMAIVLARSAQDPLYTKYAKFNGIRLALRDQIYKKYGSRAASRARDIMSGVSK
jgi:hypothetical protein